MITVLETQRLILKVPDDSDLNDLIALRTDIEVMRCVNAFDQPFGHGTIQKVEEITHHLSLAHDYYMNYGLGFFCILDKITHEFIGQAGLFHVGFETSQTDIELAYRLHTAYWGKGYATELAHALIDWGLNTYQLPKIIAAAHPGNKRSIRVLDKSGMHDDGMINFRGHALRGYSITRNSPSNQDIITHNCISYNRIANRWNEKRQWYIEKPSIDRFISYLRPQSHIFDIGCGNGMPIDDYLIHQGFSVTGIDISQEMLKYAQTNVDFTNTYCEDFLTITISDTFDAIVCWCMLFHLHADQHDAALLKMRHCLNNEGILCITFADQNAALTTDGYQQIDPFTILSTQFGQSFYHSARPYTDNITRVQQAGFEILDSFIDQPGNHVIIAKKIAITSKLKQCIY